MNKQRISRWTLATVFASMATLAAAQTGGDTAGGNAGTKAPPARTDVSPKAGDTKDTHTDHAKDHKAAKGPAGSASQPRTKVDPKVKDPLGGPGSAGPDGAAR